MITLMKNYVNLMLHLSTYGQMGFNKISALKEYSNLLKIIKIITNIELKQEFLNILVLKKK